MKRQALSFSLLAFGALVGCQNASKLDQVTGVSTTRAAKVVDKPAKLEFFVMSKCPYGVQVEKAVAPVLAKLGDNVEFHVSYIGQKQGDQLSSMHGPGEVTGDIAQLCAHEVAPDKYVKMIECQDKDPGHVDTNWESCGKEAGIDTGAVKACMDSKGQQLLAASFDESAKRGATGSPSPAGARRTSRTKSDGSPGSRYQHSGLALQVRRHLQLEAIIPREFGDATELVTSS